MPWQRKALIALIAVIGLLALYESGSRFGVRHALVLNGDITREKGEERIEFLARVRHADLEPLYTLCQESGILCVNTTATQSTTTATSATAFAASISPPPTAGAGRIVFLNDVLYSYTDILRLLQYPAHLVCGLDLGMAAYPATGAHRALVRIALRSVHKRAHGWERRGPGLWCVVGGYGGLGWASTGGDGRLLGSGMVGWRGVVRTAGALGPARPFAHSYLACCCGSSCGLRRDSACFVTLCRVHTGK